MENSNNMAGGWSPRHPLTEQELGVFEQAMKGLVGVRYTPLEVSSQVVSGMNYRFVCLAESVTLVPKRYHAEIFIHQPLPGEGEPHVTEITRLLGDESSEADKPGSFCIQIPAGPLWSNDDAKKRAPFICAAHGGRFTGKWFTSIWGKMSVVECEIPYPQRGGTSFKMDVPAGPLWNNDDAKQKCDAICASYGGKWTGQWKTIVPGRMSVCECEFNW